MKIGVIGTINRDTIRLPDGTVKRGWGGMLYNIKTLSRLVGAKCRIYPACNIGADCYDEIMAIIRKLPGVHTDCIRRVAEKNNHCLLTYLDYERKEEILKGGVRPLKYGDVEGLLDSDIVLVNYISGRDIYLRTLRKIRRNYKGIIYCDIHSLTLGKRKDGSRYLRTPPEWPSVIETGDYVQMNRVELGTLVARRIEPHPKAVREGLRKLISLLRQKGIVVTKKVFIVTSGADGCFLFYFRDSRPVFQHFAPQRKVAQSDTTGCGDCFSSGFISGLAGRKDLQTCAAKANRTGLACIIGEI
jgi:sugar/nucleoside kinase (ribokinase family)